MKDIDNKRELELYIHIPFCVHKCNYCDFLSAPADKKTQNAYMEALCKELRKRSEESRSYGVSTVFIGGGTPTAVDAQWIRQVMDIVKAEYRLMADAEITMEMNPGTVTAETLKVYKESGINRISIGMQSTVDKELIELGRIHTYEQFLECFKLAREIGFENINVDIMSALPKQSFESYCDTLRSVVELGPEHISAYSLIIEEGTPFYQVYEEGMLDLPDEDTERRMYEFTGEYLKQHGYERYEISNYAKPGKECQHNVGYWERKNYLGFGIGAASMVENVRFRNGTDLNAYMEKPCSVRENIQTLTKTEQMEETMFLGLRMTKGVSWRAFERSFGLTLEQVYGSVLQKHLNNELLTKDVSEEGDYSICLTKKGMDVSNYVMSDFLEPSLF